MSPAGDGSGGARPPSGPGTVATEQVTGDFDTLYETQFPFVWRTLRRLGVPESSLDDAAQDVFVVVHRQLAGFEGRSSLRSWLFGIVRRVARDHRRRRTRKDGGRQGHAPLLPDQPDVAPGPHELAERARAWALVRDCLESLDENKREVFVLADLEGMSAPEIADVVGIPLNTVYSRLRVARQRFEAALQERTTP